MITKIITHFRPHADELVARMILRRFKEGEEKFPGVSNATTSYMASGEIMDGKTWQDFPDTIFLGCGGGPFDEHATSKKERVSDECAATLVSKYIGVDKNPALEKILFFVKAEDLGGSKLRNELPMIIKLLHARYPDEPEKISKWAEDAYFAIYKDEKDFFDSVENLSEKNILIEERRKNWQRPTLESTFGILRNQGFSGLGDWMLFAEDALKFKEKRFNDAKIEFSVRGKMETVMGPYGTPIKLAIVESDNEEMNKFARSIGAHIVFQMNSRGNVIFMTDRKKKLDLTFLFVLLRMAEQHYRGGIKIKDEEVLSKEGFVEGIPFWYLFHTRDMGFNGSLTTNEIEPTKIPKDKIVEIVKRALSPR